MYQQAASTLSQAGYRNSRHTRAQCAADMRKRRNDTREPSLGWFGLTPSLQRADWPYGRRPTAEQRGILLVTLQATASQTCRAPWKVTDGPATCLFVAGPTQGFTPKIAPPCHAAPTAREDRPICVFPWADTGLAHDPRAMHPPHALRHGADSHGLTLTAVPSKVLKIGLAVSADRACFCAHKVAKAGRD